MKRSIVMLSVGLVALGLSSGAWASNALDPATVAAAKTPAQHEAIAKAYEAQGGKLE